jgi:hypothetical protein
MNIRLRSRRARSSGQGLAELALALPVLLLLLMGVFDMGRAIIMHTSLTNGAREGARLAAVNQDKATVIDRVLGQTFMSSPNVRVDFFLPPPNPADVPEDPCGTFTDPGGVVLDPPGKGCVIVVESSTTFRAITPIIGDLIGDINLEARTTSRVEFSCPRPDDLSQPFTTAAQCPKQP